MKSQKKESRRRARRRGTALMLALMYTTLFGALAASMTLFTGAAVKLSDANDRSIRAYAAAESGMTYLLYQLRQMPKPVTAAGTIDKTLATTLWTGTTGIANALANQFRNSLNVQSQPVVVSGLNVYVPAIVLDGATSFELTVTQSSTTPTMIHLVSVGKCGNILRGVSLDVTMEKKIRYAVYSNVAIQIGKNTVVEGDVCSTYNGFGKGPPVWMLSDFRALSNMGQLDTDLTNFRNYIKDKDQSNSNRLDVRPTAAKNAAMAAGFYDRNSDGFIDEFDVMSNRVDVTHSGSITTSAFIDSTTGTSRDPELFYLLDHLSPPLLSGDPTRAGYGDGVLDNRDGYAKIKGSVQVTVTQPDWDTWARDTSSSGGSKYGTGFREQFQGPVVSGDPTVPPVQFGLDSSQLPQILPSNFDTSSYASSSGPSAGATTGSVASGSFKNGTLSAAMANGGTATEGTPYGSTSIQATYKRPVFKNVTFENCKIPKGLNALFQNCTFKGVTFVDMETNITTSTGSTTIDPNDGMTWSKKMVSGQGTFASTTALTASNSKGFLNGNNLRFDGCSFNGPVTAAVPTAYTHFANSWEFTGSTLFDNQVDPTATILAPNTNIEMGSFSDPNAAPSTLVGVVVAGNIDIRGRSFVDGSVIVCGAGAGNTTLGYFGPSDSASNPIAQPEGGYGRLYLRYNPARAMPNGISIPILLTPDTTSFNTVASPTWN